MRKCFLPFLFLTSISFAQVNKSKAIFLEDISWSEAQNLLTPDALVLIPLGAAAKEHGRHLPLGSDYLQAEYFKKYIADRKTLIVAPTINYSFYPPFLKYPGSTSLRYTTARDMVLEIVRELASYGPKKFYLINVGITTNAPLADAAKILGNEGILLFYSDYNRFEAIEAQVRTKKTGTHADELETSNLLFIAPEMVDMKKAVDDTTAVRVKGTISLTPVPQPNGAHSQSGVYGYATLATKAKGKKSMELAAATMLHEIDSLRGAKLPLVQDQSASWSMYAGEYTTSDEKKLLIKVTNEHLDYTWLDLEYSNYYPLYFYNQDVFASQVMDIIFLRKDNTIEKAICTFRGVQYELIKTK